MAARQGSGPARRRDADSVLLLVDRVLADKQRTANAKELLASVSTAIARIVLSVGLVLGSAALLVPGGVGWLIGGAVSGAGVAWRVCRRRLAAARSRLDDGPIL